MSIEHIDTIDLPTWAAAYIFNGDASGLSDNEIELVDTFEAQYDVSTITYELVEADPSFTYYPEFGLPCDCIECEVWGVPS